MKLYELYRKAIEIGMRIDWRPKGAIDSILRQAKADSDTEGFDRDRLFNPYGDTRIAFGDGEAEVKAVLVGIEIHPHHLLQAAVMRQGGARVDLALSHHMSCINRGLYHFDDILDFHNYSLAEAGVPRELYEPLVAKWKKDISYEWKMDTVNMARGLNVPLMNIHTPCDLFHVTHIRRTMEQMKDATVGQIAEHLSRTIEEVRRTPYERYSVRGDASAKPGKVYVPIGAGWAPPPELFRLACEAGINTAVLVTPKPEHLQLAAKHNVAILDVPHNSNDNFGINMLLDALQEDGELTIHDAHNFTRVRRR